MKRSTARAGAVLVGVAVTAAGARRPLKAHLAEGTLPGRCGSSVNSYLNRPSYRLVAEALDLRPEDALLDVACGWAEFLVVHAATVERVAGIDVSAEKAALARQRLADRIASGTAEVVQGDAASLPWDAGTFTAVMCMDSFPFFAEPERVLTEVHRVLRPGGRIVMQIGMRWPDGPPKHIGHPTSPVAKSEEAVRRFVEDAGFVDVSISYGAVGGRSRLANLASRMTAASDELRLVRAVRPA